MESALGWIGKLFEYIGSWIPRPFLIRSTQRGVRFKYGKNVSVIKPGIHAYVPLFTQVEVVTVVAQAIEFKPTILTTKDNKTVTVGFTMLFEITDAVKAATTTDVLPQTIGEIGESLLTPLILSSQLEDIRSAIVNELDKKNSLNSQLTRSARSLLRRYGVRVLSCRINNFSLARVIYLVNNIPS